jgi:hypothetical protein
VKSVIGKRVEPYRSISVPRTAGNRIIRTQKLLGAAQQRQSTSQPQPTSQTSLGF